MKTIEQIIDDHLTDEAAPSVETIAELRDDLIAREQEMAGTLQEVAAQFNLLPAVVTKVIQHIGLGEAPTDEQRTYVDEQYTLLLAQVERQRQEVIDKYAAIGVHVEVPEFSDPLASGPAVVIPDTPEG